MNPNIAKNIKLLREAQNMTQAELADRVGVTGATISTYEVGTRMPSYDVLISLARIFRVSTDSLLGFGSKDAIDVSKLTANQRNIVREIIGLYEKENERSINAANEINSIGYDEFIKKHGL